MFRSMTRPAAASDRAALSRNPVPDHTSAGPSATARGRGASGPSARASSRPSPITRSPVPEARAVDADPLHRRPVQQEGIDADQRGGADDQRALRFEHRDLDMRGRGGARRCSGSRCKSAVRVPRRTRTSARCASRSKNASTAARSARGLDLGAERGEDLAPRGVAEDQRVADEAVAGRREAERQRIVLVGEVGAEDGGEGSAQAEALQRRRSRRASPRRRPAPRCPHRCADRQPTAPASAARRRPARASASWPGRGTGRNGSIRPPSIATPPVAISSAASSAAERAVQPRRVRRGAQLLAQRRRRSLGLVAEPDPLRRARAARRPARPRGSVSIQLPAILSSSCGQRPFEQAQEPVEEVRRGGAAARRPRRGRPELSR